MSTPLPHHNPFDRAYLLASHCAYDRCLDLECRNTVVKKTGPLTVLMCARFLGYILIEAPTHVGREYFALEVVRCDEDEAIQALAELYKNHFIRCFRLDKSHTLVPSCRSAEEENSLPQTVASHIEAKKKDPADYYRPAATQLYFIEGFKPEVQLTTPDPRIYPLPDPQYLAIHAACARAAHLSGVAKHIDTASHEMAETEALEDDRGSGDVLHHALMRHLNI
ncbi:hypothetical protein BD779DRAFT_1680079 [Infundibulicybe gibba]|nr:hypothetical protein BD779DRAFT_1680079 [Infundibulicybe gibba]